jgi:hypothetical protein
VLHADGYAGFEQLYRPGQISEAACWAHVRRKFFDIYAANDSLNCSTTIGFADGDDYFCRLVAA